MSKQSDKKVVGKVSILKNPSELRICKKKEGEYEVQGEGLKIVQSGAQNKQDIAGNWSIVRGTETLWSGTGLPAAVDFLKGEDQPVVAQDSSDESASDAVA